MNSRVKVTGFQRLVWFFLLLNWTAVAVSRLVWGRPAPGSKRGRVCSKQSEQQRNNWEKDKRRKRAEDPNRICSIIHENAENKGLSLVEAERWRNSCIKTSRSCSARGKDCTGTTIKGGWLDLELCAKARREEFECIRGHKMYVRVPREVCQRKTGTAPIKTGWAETDKGQPGKPGVRARIQDTRQTRAVCVVTAESRPVSDRNGRT